LVLRSWTGQISVGQKVEIMEIAQRRKTFFRSVQGSIHSYWTDVLKHCQLILR